MKNEQTSSAPCSHRFNDVYYSVGGGLEESRHVFLNGSRLLSRLESSENQHTLVELGFGTGLNALVTAIEAEAVLKKSQSLNARLHYHAIEGFPLTPEALLEGLEVWRPSLGGCLDELSEAYESVLYPSLNNTGDECRQNTRVVCNTVQLTLAPRVMLSLWIGDVNDCLISMKLNELRADTWYLDGFSPAKNPEMWSNQVFQGVRDLSAPEARLATYTAAGFVRRGLMEVGFNMSKVPGFGRKREMLIGQYVD